MVTLIGGKLPNQSPKRSCLDDILNSTVVLYFYFFGVSSLSFEIHHIAFCYFVFIVVICTGKRIDLGGIFT